MSCFLAEICIRQAKFCFDSMHEIQFHSLWKDILSATIAYGPDMKSCALYWEYHINCFVHDYPGDHRIDLILVYNNLLVLFVEIAGTVIVR
ncbi:hypothetical protein BVRB_020320 [Beta vulgaris subsp. vulgaris]|uniref:Uncharacterized protein n=1 Tax=Beta vulgaris subsp. vulgaris TaxID=3555 RepID=A0A0J8B3Y3_BETVV|nr:hypothetical protein BVRB_020320 [Beta vulgaris subsp. vulgaris]